MSGLSYSYKHAFDFWYKWCPLGVDAVGDSWPTGSIDGVSGLLLDQMQLELSGLLDQSQHQMHQLLDLIVTH